MCLIKPSRPCCSAPLAVVQSTQTHVLGCTWRDTFLDFPEDVTQHMQCNIFISSIQKRDFICPGWTLRTDGLVRSSVFLFPLNKPVIVVLSKAWKVYFCETLSSQAVSHSAQRWCYAAGCSLLRLRPVPTGPHCFCKLLYGPALCSWLLLDKGGWRGGWAPEIGFIPRSVFVRRLHRMESNRPFNWQAERVCIKCANFSVVRFKCWWL